MPNPHGTSNKRGQERPLEYRGREVGIGMGAVIGDALCLKIPINNLIAFFNAVYLMLSTIH